MICEQFKINKTLTHTQHTRTRIGAIGTLFYTDKSGLMRMVGSDVGDKQMPRTVWFALRFLHITLPYSRNTSSTST